MQSPSWRLPPQQVDDLDMSFTGCPHQSCVAVEVHVGTCLQQQTDDFDTTVVACEILKRSDARPQQQVNDFNITGCSVQGRGLPHPCQHPLPTTSGGLPDFSAAGLHQRSTAIDACQIQAGTCLQKQADDSDTSCT